MSRACCTAGFYVDTKLQSVSFIVSPSTAAPSHRKPASAGNIEAAAYWGVEIKETVCGFSSALRFFMNVLSGLFSS